MKEDYYKKRALKRLTIAGLFIVFAGGLWWYLAHSISFEKIAALETTAQQVAVDDIGKDFSAPPPLIATGSAPTTGSNGLTRQGDITDTNVQRKANGNLPPLLENATLDNIASLRLQDMFAKQYFAHVSPSSSSAETVAKSVGYGYLALGENLALGDFSGDEGVIAAWMASPGHRANILNTHYTQMGVAASEGLFQGREVWIAVQIFGRPQSDCPAPDETLKSQIDDQQNQAAQIQADLQVQQARMNSSDPDQVNSYNALVGQYNELVASMKTEIAQYNGEVTTYNHCIAS